MRDKKSFLNVHGRRGLGRACAFVACRRRSAWLPRILLLVTSSLLVLLLLLAAASITSTSIGAASQTSSLSSVSSPPTTDRVYDARGKVLIELGGECRKVVSYDEVPVILRCCSFLPHGTWVPHFLCFRTIVLLRIWIY